MECKEKIDLLCELWLLNCETSVLKDKVFSGKTRFKHPDLLGWNFH